MVAGRHIGFDGVDLVQRPDQRAVDDRGIDRLSAQGQRRIGDDVRGVVEILLSLAAVEAAVDIVDQPLVERPSVHATLPLVDDRVAETVNLGLLVDRARGEPRALRGAVRLIARRREKRVDGRGQRVRRGQRVLVSGLRDVGVGVEHGTRVHARRRRRGSESGDGGGDDRASGLARRNGHDGSPE